MKNKEKIRIKNERKKSGKREREGEKHKNVVRDEKSRKITGRKEKKKSPRKMKMIIKNWEKRRERNE